MRESTITVEARRFIARKREPKNREKQRRKRFAIDVCHSREWFNRTSAKVQSSYGGGEEGDIDGKEGDEIEGRRSLRRTLPFVKCLRLKTRSSTSGNKDIDSNISDEIKRSLHSSLHDAMRKNAFGKYDASYPSSLSFSFSFSLSSPYSITLHPLPRILLGMANETPPEKQSSLPFEFCF